MTLFLYILHFFSRFGLVLTWRILYDCCTWVPYISWERFLCLWIILWVSGHACKNSVICIWSPLFFCFSIFIMILKQWQLALGNRDYNESLGHEVLELSYSSVMIGAVQRCLQIDVCCWKELQRLVRNSSKGINYWVYLLALCAWAWIMWGKVFWC